MNIQAYTKLAQLKNQSSSIERILDQPVTLKGKVELIET